jgi:DNA replication and repair protein RecF
VRLLSLTLRGFRNLSDGDLQIPPQGVALVGPNGHGKTNLLEAIGYPVLFRSLRGAPDADLVRFGEAGFRLSAEFEDGARVRQAGVTYQQDRRRKRLELDGGEVARVVDAAGAWLTVAFLPSDVALAGGSAAVRRQYLDRMLSLADRRYLRHLARYRAALAQRNAALRQGRTELAAAFDQPLAAAGAPLVAARREWSAANGKTFALELAGLGQRSQAGCSYTGAPELVDPAAWPARLAQSAPRDRARCMTTIGPHRDDLELRVDGRLLREFGSTGQQRTAAIALRLLELETLRSHRGVSPALLLDDAFAELDDDRQRRLVRRLADDGTGQVFVTSPRGDELPAELAVPSWRMEGGKVLGARDG